MKAEERTKRGNRTVPFVIEDVKKASRRGLKHPDSKEMSFFKYKHVIIEWSGETMKVNALKSFHDAKQTGYLNPPYQILAVISFENVF